MFKRNFDPSQPLKTDKAEKLAKEIAESITFIRSSLLRPDLRVISPEDRLDIAKCAFLSFGKVRGEEIEDRIDYLLGTVIRK